MYEISEMGLLSPDKQSGKDEASLVSHWLPDIAEFLVRGPRCKSVAIIRAAVQPQALGVEASTHASFLYLSLLESLWSGIWSNFVPGISTSGTRFSGAKSANQKRGFHPHLAGCMSED